MLSRVSKGKYASAVDKFKSDPHSYSCHILGSDHVWFDDVNKEVVGASVNEGSRCYLKAELKKELKKSC